MFLTPAQIEAELLAIEADEGIGVPRETTDARRLAIEAWIRSLPTPPTVVLHASEYPARAPQYKALDLLHMQEHTVEDFRCRDAKGNPVRIFPR